MRADSSEFGLCSIFFFYPLDMISKPSSGTRQFSGLPTVSPPNTPPPPPLSDG
jgi:hypothetical protein